MLKKLIVWGVVAAAIVVAVPLGVVAAKKPALGHAILTVAEVIQTVPGLALLVMLMPIVAAIGLNMVGPAPVATSPLRRRPSRPVHRPCSCCCTVAPLICASSKRLA